MLDPTDDPVLDPRWRPDVPYGDRPWAVHEGDNRCALDLYDAETFDACVTDCPYGLSDELDPENLEKEKTWQRLVEREQNPRPLRHYLTACHAEFIAANNRAPSADEWLDLADEADRRRMLESPPISALIWHWLATGENPRVTGKGFMGNEWDALVPAPNTWRAVWRVLKPGAYCLTFAGCRTHDLVTLSLRLAGFRVEDQIAWLQGQGMAKRRRLDLAIDTHLGAKDKRPVIRPRPQPSATKNTYGKMAPPEQQVETSAATPEAARHVGWDRGLAPRHEPVVVATKPMRGKVAETALRYGTGGMHVDACRIQRGDAGETLKATNRKRESTSNVYGGGLGFGDGHQIQIDPRGGYPTNAIIDEGVAAELDAQVRRCGGASPASGPTHDGESEGVAHGKRAGMRGRPAAYHGKVDGPSAFFYVPKARTSERDAGLDDLDVMMPGERSGREEDTAGINGYAGTRGEARNPHPTVKGIRLMQKLVRESLLRYLSRLASPPGAWHSDVRMRPLVLDPFCGSGSTLVAALREGVRIVGCELNPVYADVARRRCQHAYALPREAADGEARPAPRVSTTTGQASLF